MCYIDGDFVQSAGLGLTGPADWWDQGVSKNKNCVTQETQTLPKIICHNNSSQSKWAAFTRLWRLFGWLLNFTVTHMPHPIKERIAFQLKLIAPHTILLRACNLCRRLWKSFYYCLPVPTSLPEINLYRRPFLFLSCVTGFGHFSLSENREHNKTAQLWIMLHARTKCIRCGHQTFAIKIGISFLFNYFKCIFVLLYVLCFPI